MDNLSPLVAFIGGLASLLSPCILPMIPVYIASLSGPEVLQGGAAQRRLPIFLHSLSFIAGFSVVFIVLGSGIGLIGFAISAHQVLVRWISGSLMILLGLFMLAATRINWLNFEKRLSPGQNATGGYLRSFVIGLIFALAWTPCVGPVLGGILTLALNSGSGWQGGYLLAFYSLGVGLPFLVIGLAFDSLAPWLKRINRYSGYIYIFSGLLLIVIGILILINKLSWFGTLT
jgi:cytochrome c-type biogenesis protein